MINLNNKTLEDLDEIYKLTAQHIEGLRMQSVSGKPRSFIVKLSNEIKQLEHDLERIDDAIKNSL